MINTLSSKNINEKIHEQLVDNNVEEFVQQSIAQYTLTSMGKRILNPDRHLTYQEKKDHYYKLLIKGNIFDNPLPIGVFERRVRFELPLVFSPLFWYRNEYTKKDVEDTLKKYPAYHMWHYSLVLQLPVATTAVKISHECRDGMIYGAKQPAFRNIMSHLSQPQRPCTSDEKEERIKNELLENIQQQQPPPSSLTSPPPQHQSQLQLQSKLQSQQQPQQKQLQICTTTTSKDKKTNQTNMCIDNGFVSATTTHHRIYNRRTNSHSNSNWHTPRKNKSSLQQSSQSKTQTSAEKQTKNNNNNNSTTISDFTVHPLESSITISVPWFEIPKLTYKKCEHKPQLCVHQITNNNIWLDIIKSLNERQSSIDKLRENQNQKQKTNNNIQHSLSYLTNLPRFRYYHCFVWKNILIIPFAKKQNDIIEMKRIVPVEFYFKICQRPQCLTHDPRRIDIGNHEFIGALESFYFQKQDKHKQEQQ